MYIYIYIYIYIYPAPRHHFLAWIVKSLHVCGEIGPMYGQFSN